MKIYLQKKVIEQGFGEEYSSSSTRESIQLPTPHHNITLRVLSPETTPDQGHEASGYDWPLPAAASL